ncbi:MAG UNVERIFIED_CONTAM: SMP-30/gluconolactonase/LRE family protein [Planctomycetaceae bacterium]
MLPEIFGSRISRTIASTRWTLTANSAYSLNRPVTATDCTPNDQYLLACEMDGRLKMFRLSDAQQFVLAAEYEGKRFNAPNDLVVDQAGGIYFTDPRYRAPEPWPQGTEAVY